MGFTARMDPAVASNSSIRKEVNMLRTRFGRIRAVVGVAVLSLALLAGIAGTTEPAEARSRSNIEWFCEATGGTIKRVVSGSDTYIFCDWDDGSTAWCRFVPWWDLGGDICAYVPAVRFDPGVSLHGDSHTSRGDSPITVPHLGQRGLGPRS